MRMLSNFTTQRTPRNRDPLFRLFENFFQDSQPETWNTANELLPRTNIAETEKAFVVSLEMPGLDESNIQVEMHDGQLVVTAERRDETENKERTWHRVEHRYGRFERTLTMPKGTDPAAISAVYDKGILTLTIPKTAAPNPTRIKVQKS